jgi:hypothetical protein
MDDLISKQAVIDAFWKLDVELKPSAIGAILNIFDNVQSETCEGCKHFDKWENEVEYGYPSPCTCCKRRMKDHYEK